MRTSWTRAGAAAVVLAVLATVVAVAAPSPAAASTAAPNAELRWEIPPRLIATEGFGAYYLTNGFFSCGGAVQDKGCSVPPDQIPVHGYHLVLDACASTGASSYTFRIVETGQSTSGVECEQSIDVPHEGPWTVEVTAQSGGQIDTAQVIANPRDLLFASLGDSYGSGEGAVTASPEDLRRHEHYDDVRCHRDRTAAAAQAAARLERSDPHTSITFIHLACSGAQLMDNKPFDSDAAGGLLHPYKGIEPVAGEVLPPQVQELKRIVGDREVDLLHLSIGGNDMGFADIIKDCMNVDDAWALVDAALGTHCYEGADSGTVPADPKPAWYTFRKGIGDLPARYHELANHLKTFVAAERVYLSEYPDPTKSDDGSYCNGPLGFDDSEYHWADVEVGASLSAVMRQAAQAEGWSYVGGNVARFRNHGYCASDRWFTQLVESIVDQGDITGTFHPNFEGQVAMAETLFNRLSADIANPPGPPEIRLVPLPSALPVLVGRAGSNGWYTGECNVMDDTCRDDRVFFTARIEDDRATKGPVEDNLVVRLDGQPVTITPTGSASTFTCTPPAGIGACDVYTSGEPNPKTIDVIVRVDVPGVHTLDIEAADVDGRTSSASYELKFDGVAPIAEDVEILDGTEGEAGWYRSPVTLTFSGADESPGAGLNRIDALERFAGDGGRGHSLVRDANLRGTVARQGRTTVLYQAVDNAGLRSPLRSLVLDIDSVAPTVTGVADRAPDTRGWYRSPVTVSFSATDPAPGSGLAGIARDEVLHEGADQSIEGSAADVAGNEAFVLVDDIDVDLTPPKLAIGDGEDLLSGTTVTDASSLTVAYEASDALSGLHAVRLASASSTDSTGALTIGLEPGINELTLEAEDVAGHVTEIPFEVLLVPPADPAVAAEGSRGAGAWKPSRDSASDAVYLELLRFATFASSAFGESFASVDDADDADAVLGYGGPDRLLKLRRQLFAAWLNVVSGRVELAAPVEVDARTAAVLGASPDDALGLLRAVETRLSTPLRPADIDTLRQAVTQLNE